MEMFFYLFEEFVKQDIAKFSFYADHKVNVNVMLNTELDTNTLIVLFLNNFSTIVRSFLNKPAL